MRTGLTAAAASEAEFTSAQRGGSGGAPLAPSSSPRRRAREQCFRVRRGQRGREMEALPVLAAQRPEECELAGRLDALGDDLAVQVVGQLDDRAYDGGVGRGLRPPDE